MSPEITSAIIALAGVALSTLTSWHIAHSTAKAETKRLILTWKHEAEISRSAAFSEMTAAANAFIARRSPSRKQAACEKILLLCSKESPEALPPLLNLYELFANPPEDSAILRAALSEVVHQQSEHRADTQNP